MTEERLKREAAKLVYSVKYGRYEWKVADVLAVVKAAIELGMEIGVEEEDVI